MQFKKVTMVRETDEWVLELAGHGIPLTAIKTAVQAAFFVILVYWALALGQSTAMAYVENIKTASTPSCDSQGVCTVCTPYTAGSKVEFNCTTLGADKPQNGTYGAPIKLNLTDSAFIPSQ